LCHDGVAAAAAAVCCCSTSEMMSDPFSGPTGDKYTTVLVPQLTVTPEVGRPAKVSVYNIYAGAD
jgi:hypothetical protein